MERLSDSGRIWQRAVSPSGTQRARAALLPSKLMLPKEYPHLFRRVDAAAISSDHPLCRDPLAAGSLMAFSLDRIEHHVRIVSALRLFEALRPQRRRFDRIRSALVSPRPIRHKARNTRT